MRRKLFFLALLLLLALAIGGVVKFLSGRSPKLGELRVDSSPTSSVFLDNKLLGRSPYDDKVQAGNYVVKIVPETIAAQVSPWEGKITIGPSLLTYIKADLSDSELASAVDVLWLTKASGQNPELSVLTNPDGATVVVDEATKGITPLSITDLTSGDHAVTITSPGFQTRTFKVRLTPGYKLIASVKLALSTGAPPTSSATASSSLSVLPSPRPTGSATSSAVPDPVKPFVLIKDTPTGFLRVRLEPSTSATEAAQVHPGEKYHVFDSQSGWFQISYDNTNKGWVSGQYAEEVQ